MNFNYGYNLNLRVANVEQKKAEEKGKEEVEGKEIAVPNAVHETIVLTGNADAILADIAKATVKGAAPQKGPKDDPLAQAWNQYLELKEEYNTNYATMNYEEKLEALNTMEAILESILDDPNAPSDIWDTAHAELYSCLKEKIEAMGAQYDCNSQNMSFQDKWAFLHDIESIIGDINSYGDYPEPMNGDVNIYLSYTWGDIIDKKAEAIADALDHGDINHMNAAEYTDDIMAKIVDVMAAYEDQYSSSQIHELMTNYMEMENMHTQAANSAVNPPAGGTAPSQSEIISNYLGAVENIYMTSNYQFVFEHLSEGGSYNYFQAKVRQNEGILERLNNYREILLNSMSNSAKGTRGNVGIAAPPDLLAEINQAIAHFTHLLNQARHFLNLLPIAVAHVEK